MQLVILLVMQPHKKVNWSSVEHVVGIIPLNTILMGLGVAPCSIDDLQ